MNPLECLERKREEILKEYYRVLCVGFGSSSSKAGAKSFALQKKVDLAKIKEIIDCYELTIETLKAMNNYEYLGDND